MLTVTADTKDMQKALTRLAYESGKDAVKVGYETMWTWSNSLIRMSPPFKNIHAGGISKQDERIGKDSISKAFSLIFEAVQKKTMLKKLGVEIMNEARVEAHHRSQLTRRGRVRRNPDVRFAQRTVINRVINQNWKHVGRLKAGWLNASTYFAKQIGKNPKAPAWVKRHGTSEGRSRRRVMIERGYNLEGINKVPYVDNSGAVKKAVDITKPRMVRHLEKKTQIVIDNRIKRFNKKKAA